VETNPLPPLLFLRARWIGSRQPPVPSPFSHVFPRFSGPQARQFFFFFQPSCHPKLVANAFFFHHLCPTRKSLSVLQLFSMCPFACPGLTFFFFLSPCIDQNECSVAQTCSLFRRLFSPFPYLGLWFFIRINPIFATKAIFNDLNVLVPSFWSPF